VKEKEPPLSELSCTQILVSQDYGLSTNFVLHYNGRQKGAYQRRKRVVPDRANALIAWDDKDDPDGNVQHIAEHDLSIEEVESVVQEPSSTEGTSRSSGRPMVFGWTTTGRFIAVVFEWRSDNPPVLYPITAYEVEP
jgi:uncharacterized DUF497 family protein